ncbi:hypothetical protein [Arenibaculum pallidiluteum]|uniref:hypothetical protein n=1 Tax=Arenibaculum pallidiluteum TaxID=2812559 RepID=UPI001A979314|nr:hypothetical protein [Arenibaculum pallidiluteum]
MFRRPKRPVRFEAAVTARYIPLLSPLTGENLDVPHLLGYRVEPHPDGGVLLIACNGESLAAIYDKAGHASRPGSFLLPDGVVDACRMPVPPPLYGAAGEELSVQGLEIPGWMKPGLLHVTDEGASVASQDEKAPGVLAWWEATSPSEEIIFGEDFRLVPDPWVDWRSTFKDAGSFEGSDESYTLDPTLIELFRGIAGYDDPMAPARGLVFQRERKTGLVLVGSLYLPEFFGALLPIPVETDKGTLRRPVQTPDWLRTAATNRAGDGSTRPALQVIEGGRKPAKKKD